MPTRKYYAENREKVKAAQAAYRANHRAEARARTAAWKLANRERTRFNVRRYEAQRRGAPGNFTSDDWAKTLDEFDNACAYCHVRGIPLQEEHITPLSRGGLDDKSNIVPACGSCNLRKGAKTLFEFAAIPSPSWGTMDAGSAEAARGKKLTT